MSNQKDTKDIQEDCLDEFSTEEATITFSNDDTIHVEETDPSQNMPLHSNTEQKQDMSRRRPWTSEEKAACRDKPDTQTTHFA